VGFPASSLEYEVSPGVRISASYEFPYSVDAEISANVLDHWTLFAAFSDAERAFAAAGLRGSDRLFSSRRGLRGTPTQARASAEVLAAAGWGFDRSLKTGFDDRALTNISVLQSGFYLRVQLSFAF